MSDPLPKIYIPAEERLNVWTHALGVLLAVGGGIDLLLKSRNGIMASASLLYAASILVLFGASALYHAAKDPERRAKLRLLDHSAIYLLIAGTYTPLMLGALAELQGYLVLGAVWGLGIIGVTLELLKKKPFKGFSIILYVLMGWACAVIMPALIDAMGAVPFRFLLWGGIAYTAGVPFYIMRKNFCHALWHVFVLAGAGLQFRAVQLIWNA